MIGHDRPIPSRLDALLADRALQGLSADEQRELMLNGVNELNTSYEKLRAVPIDNAVAPAFVHDPLVPDASRPPRQPLGPFPWAAASHTQVLSWMPVASTSNTRHERMATRRFWSASRLRG